MGASAKKKVTATAVRCRRPALPLGVVAILQGPYQGLLGYYDDDVGEGAAVYLKVPPALTPYVVLPRSWLRRATPAEVEHWERHNMNDIEVAWEARELRRRLGRNVR